MDSAVVVMFMIPFWIVSIAVIVWLVILLTRSKQPEQAPVAPPSPFDILDARLARGEIDPETYRASWLALSQARAAAPAQGLATQSGSLAQTPPPPVPTSETPEAPAHYAGSAQ